MLHDERFAWLRSISALVAYMDEAAADADPAETHVDLDTILGLVRELTTPDENGSVYARRYHAALQERPDAVLAHRDMVSVLRRRPGQPLDPA
jgi:hypothetical protein